jgi:competence protein ComEC
MRRTSLITIGCASALTGLGLSKLASHTAPLFLLFFLGLIPKKLRLPAVLIIVGFIIGFWRGHNFIPNWQLIQRLDGQKLSLEVRATTDAIYGYGQQLDFSGTSPQLSGKIKISGFGIPMVYRGDVIRAEGRLKASTGSYQARMSYAKLTKISGGHNPIYSFTRRFSAGMQSALPEPNSSFGLGLLVGQRNNLPDELYQQLIAVGLVHIVAVSGYNLTILVRAAGRLRLFSKYQQLIMSLCLIAGFLVMTGFAASIVRAAIVSTLGLWAWYYGRQLRPAMVLAFTAALTSFINPYYIWGDLGWYLSFLAFSGILIIAPVLSVRLFRQPPKLLVAAALETFCAELMALPFIMLMFGQLSLIGLVANVLVVPLVPLAMLLSALAAITGILAPAFAGWLAWPANWLLTYMLDLVRWFASLPGIFQRRSLNLTSLLIFYSLIVAALFVFHRRRPAKMIVEKL